MGSIRREIPALVFALVVPALQAKTFTLDLGGQSVDVVSNTTVIGGAAVRVEPRDKRLVGKANNDPEVCGRGPDGTLYFQDCQGLFKDQIFPAQRIHRARGLASLNFDQGNLNYDRGDVVQAPLRLNQDFNFTWGDYGLFVKGFAFYDPVNDDFDETHPNRITIDNADQVGYLSFSNDDQGARTDSRPCPASRNPLGQPCGIVYGPGGSFKSKRRDDETLDEIGAGFHLLDLNVYGVVDVASWFGGADGHEVTFKVGRQLINWGESTVQFFDSLNVANPASANNLFRLGGNGLDDFFLPINAVSLTTEVVPAGILSVHYQLEWNPLVAPSPGSYYSSVNVGTSNAGERNSQGRMFVDNGFGYTAEDPDAQGRLLDSPLSGITNTSNFIERLPDNEPGWKGQYGIEFKYYAESFNDGTEFGFFHMRYHSRTPMLSVYSVDDSCAKAPGANVTDGATFAAACPDLPVFHLPRNDPFGATDSAVPFDTLRVQLEYPRRIEMYGLSFNTTAGGAGGISVQGEVAFRPNEPFQVAILDLAFAGYGPTLTHCHLAPGCAGSNTGTGVGPDGNTMAYGSSDYVVDAANTPGAYKDSFDAAIGHIPGSGRSFPSFIIPYRGGVVGANPGNSYIRGWEEFDAWQFNLGGTYVEGNTNFFPKLVGADQAIWLFELAGRYIPDLPSLDRLQLEAPGLEYHASAGADGSGADRSRQACSTNEACVFGPDGLRFNPHQQDRSFYPDKFSAGYSLVSLIRYESLLPGISVGAQIIFKHDVYNTSPGLASNFIEDRIIWDTLFEVRYKSNLSFHLGYQVFAGGGVANLLHDRDNARLFVKYSI